ncbi:MAG: ferrous iron transport protein B [Lachnospirales bacterium]
MAIRIALAGNPNSGKTTLFNALTGSNQFVGNWPGVTVEKKEGKLKGYKDVIVTDLPGIYSLSPYTLEEVVARNYILDEKPDVILNIIDGTNLERNLYLTTQLVETGIPVIAAVNMIDLVEKNGDKLNIDNLSKALGCKIIEISALKGTNILEAAKLAVSAVGNKNEILRKFSDDVEQALYEIENKLDVEDELKRFYAVKLFERDEKISLKNPPDVEDIIKKIEEKYDDDSESIIINERYEYITRVIKSCYEKKTENELTISDKIDKIVTNRILALPIFVAVMFIVYYVSVTTVGSIATDWANDGVFGDGWFLFGNGRTAYDEAVGEFDEANIIIEANNNGENVYVIEDEDGNEIENVITDEVLQEAVETLESEPDPSEYGLWVPGIPVIIERGLDGLNCADWLKSLILDGIVAGVGAVLGFVPQILVLFIFLAFLEACGYMARVAFIMDRIFRKFGLSGKSFIPMLIGTGCGVPGVMASRTIENERDRKMTVMTTTFIPCSAKLPIIALIAGALFDNAWWVSPSAYFMGIAAVVISGVILKKTKIFAGEASPFVMELPAYHMPTVLNVLKSMWERGWSFIKKAGTIILLSTIFVWFTSNYGFTENGFGAVDEFGEGSILFIIGNSLKWIFAPIGFGNAKATVATFTGLIAKENVVGTFGILYGAGEIAEDGAEIWSTIASSYTSVAAYSFLAFNLLCAPCFAAMGAIKREMTSPKWTCFAIGYQCVFAYVISLIIYQFGSAILLGEINVAGLIAATILVIILLYLLFRPNKADKFRVSAIK